MAPIAWSDVVAFSSPLASVDVTQQGILLAWVNKRFAEVFDGEDGVSTKLARIWAVAHFASLPGSGDQRPAGPVVSQSRGGLSQSYASPPGNGADPNWSATQWGQRLATMLQGSKAAWPRTP